MATSLPPLTKLLLPSTSPGSLSLPLLPPLKSLSTTRKSESNRRRKKKSRTGTSSSPQMTEPSSLLHPSKLPTPKLGAPSPNAAQASSKSLLNLLYKLAFFVVFVALLPLFPFRAPEFVSETISTGIWELLHLLFVGVAISYGLFSRRNADQDMEKEPLQKPDGTGQSFVSQILHVPSVFDDDEVDSLHESKVQTWSSQYYRNEPVVLAANGGRNGGHVTIKPLLLPIRSLKSHSQYSESSDDVDGHFGLANGIRERLDSRKGSEESVVLPSPIPWRSRSGGMEMECKPGPGTRTAPSRSYSLPPAFDADKVLSRTSSFRSPASHTSSSATPSPRMLSPSPSLPREIRARSSEDMAKRKGNHKSTPPPAPPPPPPPAYLGHGHPSTSERKVTARSFKDELKDMSRRGREGWQSNHDTVVNPPLVSTTNPRNSFEGPPLGSSVRTVIKAKDVQSAAMDRATRTRSEHSMYLETRRQSPPVPKYPSEKRNEFIDKVVISSDNSDSDDHDIEVAMPSSKHVSSSAPEAGADENEVDKKADEFIAKFREQIRLQRIEDIKRSTRQRSNRKPQ